MKLAAAQALADLIDKDELNADCIIPAAFDLRVGKAVAAEVREKMLEKGGVGAFGSGGIHAYFVKMLREGALPRPVRRTVL